MAQSVERILGKDEVAGSIPAISSMRKTTAFAVVFFIPLGAGIEPPPPKAAIIGNARSARRAEPVDSGHQLHVVASFISLATTFYASHQKSSRAHFAAPPLQTEPAPLGFGLGFGRGI